MSKSTQTAADIKPSAERNLRQRLNDSVGFYRTVLTAGTAATASLGVASVMQAKAGVVEHVQAMEHFWGYGTPSPVTTWCMALVFVIAQIVIIGSLFGNLLFDRTGSDRIMLFVASPRLRSMVYMALAVLTGVATLCLTHYFEEVMTGLNVVLNPVGHSVGWFFEHIASFFDNRPIDPTVDGNPGDYASACKFMNDPHSCG